MSAALIIDAVRTPNAIGKPGGAYADIHPVDLHAHLLRSLVDRVGLDPAEIDDVISGSSDRWVSKPVTLPGGRPWQRVFRSPSRPSRWIVSAAVASRPSISRHRV